MAVHLETGIIWNELLREGNIVILENVVLQEFVARNRISLSIVAFGEESCRIESWQGFSVDKFHTFLCNLLTAGNNVRIIIERLQVANNFVAFWSHIFLN